VSAPISTPVSTRSSTPVSARSSTPASTQRTALLGLLRRPERERAQGVGCADRIASPIICCSDAGRPWRRQRQRIAHSCEFPFILAAAAPQTVPHVHSGGGTKTALERWVGRSAYSVALQSTRKCNSPTGAAASARRTTWAATRSRASRRCASACRVRSARCLWSTAAWRMAAALHRRSRDK
jgi:hypothetical protein